MKIKKEETELLRFVRDRLFLSSFFPDYQIPMRPMRPMRPSRKMQKNGEIRAKFGVDTADILIF